MIDELKAALFVGTGCIVVLAFLFFATRAVADQQAITKITVTRVNGPNVTTEVGTVQKWSLSGGHMVVEFAPDSILSSNFDARP